MIRESRGTTLLIPPGGEETVEREMAEELGPTMGHGCYEDEAAGDPRREPVVKSE